MRRIVDAARIITNTAAMDVFIREMNSTLELLVACAGPDSPPPQLSSPTSVEETQPAVERSAHHLDQLSVLHRQIEALMVTSAANIHDHYLNAQLAMELDGERWIDTSQHLEVISGPHAENMWTYRGETENTGLTDGELKARRQEAKAVETARTLAVSEVSCATRLGERFAYRLVNTSSNMAVLPATTSAMWAGKITLAQAEQISKGADILTGSALQSYDHELARYVGESRITRSPRAVRTRIANVRAKFGAENQETRRLKELATRCVYVDNELDGIVTLIAKLPAESAHAIYNTVTDIALTAKHQGDARTLEQLRADALVGLFITNPNTVEQSILKNIGDPLLAGTVIGPRPSALLDERTWIPRTSGALSAAPLAPNNAGPSPDSADLAPNNAGICPNSAEFSPSKTGPSLSIDSEVRPINSEPPGGNDPGEASAQLPRVLGTQDSGPPGSNPPDNDAGSEKSSGRVISTDASRLPPVEHGVGVRAVINVYVPARTLIGESEEPATLAGYGPLSPNIARKLAAKADTLYRIMTDPATGSALGQGRKSYKVSNQTREYLKLLSDTCEFPCCSVSSNRTDADHIIPWDAGGPTDPENLQLLCRKHHNLKTKYGWNAIRHSDGTTTWTSPLGNTYLTTKEPQAPVQPPTTLEKPPF